MKKITSEQNPRIKAAIRLKTSRGRKMLQRIIIFGLRELQRAIRSGIHPLEVFLSSEMMTQEALAELTGIIPVGSDVYDLPESLMARLRYGQRSESVVAIAQRPNMELDRMDLASAGSSPLVVILESIEKPGNIGAVLRSMDGAGASAVVMVDPQCDVFHPNCIRASMASVFTIPIAIASGDETLQWCQQQGIPVCGLSDSASMAYTAVDWTGPMAMVLGSESAGLSARWLDPPVQTATIPMQGISDSLNISVAAAVVLFEARRQRLSAGTTG